MPRINSNEYRDVKIHLPYNEEKLENNYLFSYKTRITKTKITPDDLPESYIKVYFRGNIRYINAANIKSIIYKPNYIFNHVHKDDFIFFSYNKPISINMNANFIDEKIWDYDNYIWGNSIIDFVKAVEKYSGLDVSNIIKEIKNKEKWFYDGNENPEPDFQKNKECFGVNFIDKTK